MTSVRVALRHTMIDPTLRAFSVDLPAYRSCREVPRSRLILLAVEGRLRDGTLSRVGLGSEMAAAALALGIEAEGRKRAFGVVPAQPKARPSGQRPILSYAPSY